VKKIEFASCEHDSQRCPGRPLAGYRLHLKSLQARIPNAAHSLQRHAPFSSGAFGDGRSQDRGTGGEPQASPLRKIQVRIARQDGGSVCGLTGGLVDEKTSCTLELRRNRSVPYSRAVNLPAEPFHRPFPSEHIREI